MGYHFTTSIFSPADLESPVFNGAIDSVVKKTRSYVYVHEKSRSLFGKPLYSKKCLI